MRYAEINKEIIEEGPIWDKTKQAAKAAAVVGVLGAATIGSADAAQNNITWKTPSQSQSQSGIVWKDPGAPNTNVPAQLKQEIKPSKCMRAADGKTIDCYMSDGGKTSINAVDRDGKRLSKRDIQQRLKAAYSLYVMKKNNYTINEPNYEMPEPKTKVAPKVTPKKDLSTQI